VKKVFFHWLSRSFFISRRELRQK